MRAMDEPQGDPRPALAQRLDSVGSADLPALAAAWSQDFSDDLTAAHLILSEHERGDLSHVLGPVLDRVPELAAYVTGDELLTGERQLAAERALDVLEGLVVAVHAADLLPADRRERLVAPWRRAFPSGSQA
jgi:hypothetical protein